MLYIKQNADPSLYIDQNRPEPIGAIFDLQKKLIFFVFVYIIYIFFIYSKYF